MSSKERGGFSNVVLRSITPVFNLRPRHGYTLNLLKKLCAVFGGRVRFGYTSRLLRFASFDSDAIDFVSRAGLVDTTQMHAINNLVLSAKQHGWWDKCDLIYPFVGGTANTHAPNLKSSSFTITWVGAVTHNANGITGDTSTAHGNTHFVPSLHGVNLKLSSAHVYAYKRTHPTVNAMSYFGARPLSGSALVLAADANPTKFGPMSVNSSGVASGGISGLGGFAINRANATTCDLYYSNVKATASRNVGAFPYNEMLILARNTGTGSVAAATFCDVNLSAFSLGGALTQQDFLDMDADWHAFQTALGRQV